MHAVWFGFFFFWLTGDQENCSMTRYLRYNKYQLFHLTNNLMECMAGIQIPKQLDAM